MTHITKHSAYLFWVLCLLTTCLVSMVILTSCSQQNADNTQTNEENPQVSDVLIEDNNDAATDQTEQSPAPETHPPVKSDQMQTAQNEVTNMVANYGDSVAVAVVPLDGSQGFSINGNKSFVSASMIKLLILADYMDAVDSNQINPMATYTLQSGDIVGGTGVLQSAGAGTTYSYDELVRDMIMYSDNTATNVIIDALGMDSINAKAQTLGLSSTNLQRKMMDTSSGVENHISANNAASILAGIANHTIASTTICQTAETDLQQQTDIEGLAQGLPSNVLFGHKTGMLGSVRHDGGIVYAEKPYVIVVLTDIGGGSSANSLMSQISSTVYSNLG